MAELTPRRIRIFTVAAWATLGFTVLVILGGMVVRATGSGDGCGESWPKCQCLGESIGVYDSVGVE